MDLGLGQLKARQYLRSCQKWNAFQNQLSIGPPLGRTYAAPPVCWGGGGRNPPPPLFGFGEERICCIRVHQLKGQFSRYV